MTSHEQEQALRLTRCATILYHATRYEREYASRYGMKAGDDRYSSDEVREALAFLNRLGVETVLKGGVSP